MKVKVTSNVQIVHNATVYGPGDVIDVPDDDANNIATEWIDAGWATEVKGGSAVGGKATPHKKPT